MSGLIDQYGNPLRKQLLTRDVAAPTLAGVRSPISGYPADGILCRALGDQLGRVRRGRLLCLQGRFECALDRRRRRGGIGVDRAQDLRAGFRFGKAELVANLALLDLKTKPHERVDAVGQLLQVFLALARANGRGSAAVRLPRSLGVGGAGIDLAGLRICHHGEDGEVSARADLFGERPRRRRRVMMHVVDAGLSPAGGKAIHYKCGHCGFDQGWTRQTEPDHRARRGRPCPQCNA